MSRSKVTAFVIFSMITFILFACQQKTQEGKTKIVNDPTPVSAHEKVFKEAHTRLENLKSLVQKDIKIYKMSVKNRRSILDDRESKIAKESINKRANELLVLAKDCLKNGEVIRNVSSSQDTYVGYKEFAERTLNEYQ